MSFNASPYYTELPITGSASCEYTGPLYDASVVTNATPDTSNAHNGLSYVQPSVFISPQTSSDMTVPAATLTSTQNLQTQARLLPLAPRPSAVPPVVPQDTTPAGTFSCIGTRIRRRYNSEGLSKVNQVREDGACLRCKLYRIGVSIQSARTRYRRSFLTPSPSVIKRDHALRAKKFLVLLRYTEVHASIPVLTLFKPSEPEMATMGRSYRRFRT